MSVSYHLVPTNKATGKFENLFQLTGKRQNNELNKLADVMIQYPERILAFFEKDREYFDFVFALLKEEISTITFEPELIKEKLLFALEMLKTKDSFPIHRYNYFGYEDVKVFNFLNVTVHGAVLNKIVKDKDYIDSANYDLKTSFDNFNNYRTSGNEFYQASPVIYIHDENNNRTTSSLDLEAFPSKIPIVKVERDYGFGKAIHEVDLLLKAPYEHFHEELTNLITICEECSKHNLGIKTYVEC